MLQRPDARELPGGPESVDLAADSCREAVERYLRSGRYDSRHDEYFPGADFVSRARRAHDALRGALVEDVKSGSWAELGSLYIGDLIVEVDGQPVKDLESLKSIMADIAEKKKPFVIIKVLRGIHTAFLELEPAWKK